MEMAVASALDRRPEVTLDDVTPSSPPPRSALFRLVLLGALAILLVASLVGIAVLKSHRTGNASGLQSEREAAMATTQQFVLRVNTYGPSLLDSQGQMPEYRSRVKAVITPKFAASFDQSVPVAEREELRPRPHLRGVLHRRRGDRQRLGAGAGRRLDQPDGEEPEGQARVHR
jgi:hypothetical protein